jgi:hypothetical protein
MKGREKLEEVDPFDGVLGPQSPPRFFQGGRGCIMAAAGCDRCDENAHERY